MRRAYTVAPNGLVGEIFSDGRIMIVEKVHPGFQIARMVGVRGESPSKFVLIRWQDSWLEELLQQKAVSDYCSVRVIPRFNIETVTTARRCIIVEPQTSNRQTIENLFLQITEETEEIEETEINEAVGTLEDIVSALRTCCTFSSEQELMDQARRIYANKEHA